MTTHTIELGSATLTRVGYADVPIPPEAVAVTASDLARVEWCSPVWAAGEQLRVGAASWIADTRDDGKRLVFDPLLAADGVLRADRAAEAAHQAAIARAFADAGFPRESVDRVVLSHIEGVGMVAWRDADGRWSPFFPNARVCVSEPALRDFVAAAANASDDMAVAAWRALIDQGRVDTYADGDEIAAGVFADVKGGHAPGHALLHFVGAAGVPVLTMLGHLAVSPIHLATGECAALHADPKAAWSLLRGVASDGRLLVGPLWPAPGFGRFEAGALVPGS